jgi:hypothetical protein
MQNQQTGTNGLHDDVVPDRWDSGIFPDLIDPVPLSGIGAEYLEDHPDVRGEPLGLREFGTRDQRVRVTNRTTGYSGTKIRPEGRALRPAQPGPQRYVNVQCDPVVAGGAPVIATG